MTLNGKPRLNAIPLTRARWFVCVLILGGLSCSLAWGDMIAIVDDMESYTPWNAPGPNIFDVWIDGVGDCTDGSGNETGANVGISGCRFREDHQCMVLGYDNDGMVFNPCTMCEGPRTYFYSMIKAQTADLPSGIGSGGGATTLSILWCGHERNSIEEDMWIKLGGRKVVYGENPGEDPCDIAHPKWRRWNIPISGSDAAFSEIAIGFGTPGASTEGGRGVVYIDEIVLLDVKVIVESVDPHSQPDLMESGSVTQDRNKLGSVTATPGIGLAADGVTPVLIRANVPGPGSVIFALRDKGGGNVNVGFLSAPGGDEQSADLDVNVDLLLRGRYRAFAVLTAPPAFLPALGDEKDDRTIVVQATFVPSEGEGYFTSSLELRLVRPPVIMLPGLWGDRSAFSTMEAKLRGAGFLFLRRPQLHDKSGAFRVNDRVLPDSIRDVVADVRRDGYACTKVDIVGHSMGGLVAKDMSEEFAQHNVRKIITIGTPHLGSPLANRLYDFYWENLTIGERLEQIIDQTMHTQNSINGGAIWNLRADPNNSELRKIPIHINGVDCEHMIVGLRDGSISWFSTVLRLLTRFDLDLEAIHDEIFEPNVDSDWVVSKASQQGGEGSDDPEPVVWHCTETYDDDILSRVLYALDLPAETGYSAPASLMSAFSSQSLSQELSGFEERENSPTSTPDGTVMITEPHEGQTCVAGQSLTVAIEGTGDTTHAAVFVHYGSSSWSDIVVLPWQGEVNLPIDCVGSEVQVAVLGLASNIQMTDEDEVNLILDSNLALEEIVFGIGKDWTFNFREYPDQSPELRLFPTGRFSNGSEYPLSVLSEQTIYSSSDGLVAAVDSNGLVTALSIGATVITATNSRVSSQIAMSVEATSGDFDLDGRVNFEDFGVLAGEWLQVNPLFVADVSPPDGGDGIVDFLDLRVLAENWLVAKPWMSDPTHVAPSVTSSPPPADSTIGTSYMYDVDAVGIPEPVYLLITSPPGMTIDSQTGLIAWVPESAQIGPHVVTVRAYNIVGSDDQTFSINVTAQILD